MCLRRSNISINSKRDIDFLRRLIDKEWWLSTDLYLLRKHVDEARKVGKMLTNNTTDWFLPYCEHCHNARTTQRAIRGHKGDVSKELLSVLLKIVKGHGELFCTLWLVDVEMVYMPLNLDHHWVSVEINLTFEKIIRYDSMTSKTHKHQATMKFAHITYVLPDVLQSLSNEDCDIFILKVIEFLSAIIPLDVISFETNL
ncbi:unnamed protein product [Malus baccata var. baccata]